MRFSRLALTLLVGVLTVATVRSAIHAVRPKPEFTGRIVRLIDGRTYGTGPSVAAGAPLFYVLITPTDGTQDSTGAPWCVGLNDSSAFCALVDNQIVRCRVKQFKNRWATLAP